MKVDTLEKLYHDQMAGLQRGGEDLLALLPDLVGVVMHFDLRNSIRDFIPRLREQIGRIEHVIPYNAVTRQVRVSPGIQGLIDECHSFLERASDPDVIDAGLVVFLQKVLHVWMVGHAALGAYAMMLGKED